MSLEDQDDNINDFLQDGYKRLKALAILRSQRK